MDPGRLPTLPQSEVTSPAHALGEDTGTSQAIPVNPFQSPRTTVRINTDTSHFSHFVGNSSSPTSSEALVKLDNEASLHLPKNNNDNPAQPTTSSIRFPDPVFGRRETRTSNNNNRFSDILTRKEKGDDPSFDWKENAGKHTVGERLQFTLTTAIAERKRYAAKAKWTGCALNVAIGLQVLLGSLTTGLSAFAVSGGTSAARSTTALGAIATLIASYLARARGSNEPELSITRCKDLDQFIRKCKAFQMDHGHIAGNELDNELIGFRHKFEELLGNANGERKLSPV